MKIQTVIPCILFFCFAFAAQGKAQDKKDALLKKHVKEQFHLMGRISISYSINDFSPIRKPEEKIDPPSEKRLKAMEDSLKIDRNPDLVMRLGFLHGQLNHPKQKQALLYEAAKKKETLHFAHPDSIALLEELQLISMELGELQNASACAQTILKIDPTHEGSLNSMSFLAIQLGAFQESGNFCDQTIAHYPTSSTGYIFKTLSLLYPQMMRLPQNNTVKDENFNFNLDLSFLRKAEAAYPENLEIKAVSLCSRFIVWFYETLLPSIYKVRLKSMTDMHFTLSPKQVKEMEAYEQEFNSLSENEAFQNPFALRYSQGVMSMLKNDFEGSIPIFQACITELPPKYWNIESNLLGVYDNIISSYQVLGDSAKTEEWLTKKVEEKISIAPLGKDYINLGCFKASQGEFTTARKLMYQALEQDSSSAEAYIQLANMDLLKGDIRNAEQNMALGYLIDDEQENIIYTKVLLALHKGDKNSAAYLLDQILITDEESEFALELKAAFIDE